MSGVKWSLSLDMEKPSKIDTKEQTMLWNIKDVNVDPKEDPYNNVFISVRKLAGWLAHGTYHVRRGELTEDKLTCDEGWKIKGVERKSLNQGYHFYTERLKIMSTLTNREYNRIVEYIVSALES